MEPTKQASVVDGAVVVTTALEEKTNPLACRVKGCNIFGNWLPVLIIPKGGDGGNARMLLQLRVCTVHREEAKGALVALALTQQDRLKKAFTVQGRSPPDKLEDLTVVYVRPNCTEARKAAKAGARGFSV